MTDLSFYEKVVPSAKKKQNLIIKIAVIAAFSLLMILWILSALAKQYNPAIIIIVAALASLFLALFLRPLSVEYEYSVSDSLITLAKIYGKSRRKEIFSAEPDDILLIAPRTEENLKKAESYKPSQRYDIFDQNTSNKLWIVVFQNEKEEKILFSFEAEDYVTKILKQLKPSAISFR